MDHSRTDSRPPRGVHPSPRTSGARTATPGRRPVGVRGAAAVVCTALVATLLALVTVTVAAAPASAEVAIRLLPEEASHLQRINDWRAARGLSRLRVDPMLQVTAREWTPTMVDAGQLSHDPNLDDDCFAASSTCSAWAENVGYSDSGEGHVFQLFTESPGHAANLASSRYTHVAVAVMVEPNGRAWVTQRFIACSCRNDDVATQQNAAYTRFTSFSQALGQDFLGRPATTGERRSVVTGLLYGVPMDQVVRTFAASDTWVGALVDAFYQSTLGRGPDDRGKRYWIDVYHGGTTPAEIAAAFYASPEYFSRAGGTNRAWVADLYREILGRSGDAGGIAYWAGLVDEGEARTNIAGSFYQSQESRDGRVTDLYRLLLGRNPDSGGLRYWSDVLLDGRDVKLAIALASSPEYLSRAQRRYP